MPGFLDILWLVLPLLPVHENLKLRQLCVECWQLLRLRLEVLGTQHTWFAAKFCNLQKLILGRCALKLSNLDISQLLTLTSLQHLELSELRDTVDLSQLARLPSLVHLELMMCTDFHLQHLSGISSLQVLEIRHCEQITEVGMRFLSRCSHLQALSLRNPGGGWELSDEGLAPLSGLVSLQRLHIDHCSKITTEGLRPLAGMTLLRCLKMHFFPGVKSIVHLAALVTLEHLELHVFDRVGDVSHLSHLTRLRDLSWYGDTLDARTLPRLTALRNLSLMGCGDQKYECFSQFPHLSSLHLENEEGMDVSADLSQLSSLRELHVVSVPLHDLRGLPALTALTEVDLGKVVRSDIPHLVHLMGLRRLSFWTDSPLNVGDLTHLTRLTNLECFELKMWDHQTSAFDVQAYCDILNL
jgi:Leucine-rich repeat (LRR) protein